MMQSFCFKRGTGQYYIETYSDNRGGTVGYADTLDAKALLEHINYKYCWLFRAEEDVALSKSKANRVDKMDKKN